MTEVRNSFFYTFIKTLCDYIAAIILIPLTLPLLLVLCIMIKADSKGPAIYSQKRLGKNGKEFNIYKLRSMRIDAEADGPQWAEEDDPRVTKLGRILRKTHMDELPQLINVFRHEMSLVGPRPERKVFRDEFIKTLPDFDDRLKVLPGITGYAQVRGGYDLTPEEKLRLDQEYLKIRCASLDAKIVLKTVKVAFTHEGAR